MQPALKHQHVLQRSSLQARDDAIRGIIDFIHGDGLNTAILRIHTGNVPHYRSLGRGVTSGECTSLHEFTQVYTSLHCGKWET